MIEIKYYASVYIYIILLTTLVLGLQIKQFYGGQLNKVVKINKLFALSLMLFSVFYIGLRPIVGGYFGDSGVYAAAFRGFENGSKLYFNKDLGFSIFLKYCSQLLNISQFFIFCAFLYIGTLYLACRRWFRENYLLAFVMYLGAFSFWSYGTNGIRNGIATSLVILGMAYYDRKIIMLTILSIAIGFHLSALLPVLAFIFTFFYKNTKYYLISWVLCIFLSLLMPSFWESFFAGIGFADERFAGYLLSNDFDDQFSSVGFRWDFLVYSSVPVFLGYHYIYKNGFKEKFYLQLFHTYLVANGFWILVIQASFSNRFAYLSWFLMPIVIIYPLLREKIWTNQFVKIGWILVLHFSFTYTMYLIK